MVEYTLVHIGINANNAEEAKGIAEIFQRIFGLKVKSGRSSVFAGDFIEVMKEPYMGKNGHIAIGVSDMEAAMEELEHKGCIFDMETKKFREDGTLNVIYLKDEIGGFAVHLINNRV